MDPSKPECLLQCISQHIFGIFERYKRQTCELHYTSSEIRGSFGFLRCFPTRKSLEQKSVYFCEAHGSRLNIVSPTLLRRRAAADRSPVLSSFSPPIHAPGHSKMSRLGRTRRTRVYDCNFDKGESYYRPVLDRLDGKTPVPRATEPDRDRIRTDVENRIKSALDDVEGGDDLFDSRGARAQRGRPLSSAFDTEELSDDITESLKRLRAGKKSSRFAEDIDFETNVSNLENRMRISDKILESVGIGSSEMSSARRALQENEERTEKRIARRLNDENSLTKWTALGKADDETAAAQRAKVSRARLSDLEDEMNELSERTAMREKRAARLRALVADSETSDTTVASSKVTIRSEREKKQVTF